MPGAGMGSDASPKRSRSIMSTSPTSAPRASAISFVTESARCHCQRASSILVMAPPPAVAPRLRLYRGLTLCAPAGTVGVGDKTNPRLSRRGSASGSEAGLDPVEGLVDHGEEVAG